jgi:ribosomal protein L17
MQKNEKEELIEKMYPVEKCGNELMSYILNNTNRIPELISVVKSICLQSREERFSLILNQCNNQPSIIKALSPIVSSFYERLMDADLYNGMNTLLLFAEKISATVFNGFGCYDLFEKFIEESWKNPTDATRDIIASIHSLNIHVEKKTSEQIDLLKSLFDNEIPKNVDTRIMLTAHKMEKSADYMRELYEMWLKTQPSKDDLKDFLGCVDNLPSDVIEEMIVATWDSRTRAIRENRKEYVLIIMDNTKWKSKDKKAFISTCDKELANHLTESDKLIKKIIRKIINYIVK